MAIVTWPDKKKICILIGQLIWHGFEYPTNLFWPASVRYFWPFNILAKLVSFGIVLQKLLSKANTFKTCPISQNMLGVFGRVIGANCVGGIERLLYSDWHCSVFMSQEGACVFCDSEEFLLPCEPRQFCSNTSNLFILSESGNILSFSKSQHLITTANTPPFRSIAANDDELYCISKDEVLFVYPLNNFPDSPNASLPLSMKIKNVACGPGFALFLTHSGAVFSKGIGTRGQLGHGDLETRMTPELIAALTPVTVTAIACGSWHSVCLTDTGDIYTWGSNEFGQLGHPSLNLERSRNLNDPLLSSPACINLSALPVPVDLPEDVSIVAIACGSRHTACLSEHKELLAFGWNGFGQLGFDVEPQEMPGRYPHREASDKVNRIILPFPYHSELSLSCGSWCTIVREVE
ncbi:RCC1 domain-containing protein 1 [Taenia solium]|eukprot:TsM_000119300 transcript=TsM_000119300 gene=TsM_000119300